MTYYSGSPLYNYTLARELKRQGQDVSVYSMWAENKLKENLVKDKIMTRYNKPVGEYYDLVIISQPDYKELLDEITAKRVINIVHSHYDCETPITDKRVDKYIAIRPEIKEHLVKKHKIPAEKIRVIYNGIDFKRFKATKRKSHKGDYVKVVLPCTLDMLRKKFIEYYARKASKRYRVYIYGKDYGNKMRLNKWVFRHKEVFDIEKYIADADVVAGILLGRINLEARAMGIVSFIHDPENPSKSEIFFPSEKEFRKRHDIKLVSKEIIK